MDKKEALELVQESGHELENLTDESKKDKEIIMSEDQLQEILNEIQGFLENLLMKTKIL